MGSKSSNFLLCFLLCITISFVTPSPLFESFLKCLSLHTLPSTNLSQLLLTPNTSSYSSLLNSSIQNLRFASPATPKPLLIFTPADDTHVPASVVCCRDHGLPIRVRSGGHDYEGLSYRSFRDNNPFVLVDLSRLRSVTVDLDHGVAWVQAGATVGELLYRIAEKSETHGFPAAVCPTVGVGGFISGGGLGSILRKHGLAADNVVDAKVVDAGARLLDRDAMGEDLFWAIRGGGASSFGIVVSWKVRLVPVPSTVAVLTVTKTMEQGAVELVTKWQSVAPELDIDLMITVSIQPTGDGKGASAVFRTLFLGGCSELLRILVESFPELGVEREDCITMSWLRSYLYLSGYTGGEPLELLLNRSAQPKAYNKGKSDYVTDPISDVVWEKIMGRFAEEGAGIMYMIPHGGRMSEIPEFATPYPHRRGNLYVIQYLVGWLDGGAAASDEHLGWIRRLYKEMGDYVSNNPRAAYLNHRDLDLGWNEEGSATSYDEAELWGRKYFKCNFRRLAWVKGEVDPENFFRFEQSIPPLVRWF